MPSSDANREKRHNTMREGSIAGAYGAVGVAAWFLLVDLIAAEVFFTPMRLGAAFGRVFGIAPMAESETAAFIGYTIVHFAGFAVIGIVITAIVHLSDKQPSVLAGAFLVFIISEVLIYIFISLLHATELLEHLTWPLIAVGNLIGAALVGWKLWRDHPRLGADFESALTGKQPEHPPRT